MFCRNALRIPLSSPVSPLPCRPPRIPSRYLTPPAVRILCSASSPDRGLSAVCVARSLTGRTDVSAFYVLGIASTSYVSFSCEYHSPQRSHFGSNQPTYLHQHPVRRSMAELTAAEFEEIYGDIVRSEYSDVIRERALSNVLAAREPPVIVPEGVLRVWLRKFKSVDAVTMTSIQDLQDKYGDVVRRLLTGHDTPYKLAKALRTTQSPSIIISSRMVGQWMQTFGKHKSQRMFASNGTYFPPKGVRTYFGILY